MTATEFFVEQGSEEWHRLRIGIATASRFGDIMAKGAKGQELAGAYNYRAELVTERLTGTRANGYKSPEMQWGTDNEPVARLMYQLAQDVEVTETGIFIHNSIKAGASPDGLVQQAGQLEIKCPNTATHIGTLKSQEVPKQYYWQIQGQLWMTDREWCDFISYDPRMPDNAQMFIKRVFRNDQDITALQEAVREFLNTVDQEELFIKNYKG